MGNPEKPVQEYLQLEQEIESLQRECQRLSYIAINTAKLARERGEKPDPFRFKFAVEVNRKIIELYRLQGALLSTAQEQALALEQKREGLLQELQQPDAYADDERFNRLLQELSELELKMDIKKNKIN